MQNHKIDSHFIGKTTRSPVVTQHVRVKKIVDNILELSTIAKCDGKNKEKIFLKKLYKQQAVPWKSTHEIIIKSK